MFIDLVYWFDPVLVPQYTYRSVTLQVHGCDITHGGVQPQTWRGATSNVEGCNLKRGGLLDNTLELGIHGSYNTLKVVN